MLERLSIRNWLLLLGWMGVIFLLSAQPSDGVIPTFGYWDIIVKKGAHFIAYGLLYWLAQRATGESRWSLLLTAVYAISDEYHQTFVPGRNGQATDVMIDCLGALTVYAGLRYQRYRQRQGYDSRGANSIS